jgi:hypothetical protein
MNNPVVFFEIPVNHLDRAMKFYGAVFGFAFERMTIDGNEMAMFPWQEGTRGISGALAQGDSYQPATNGSRLYFHTDDIDRTLALAVSGGGRILYPKTHVGEWGWVAEVEDTEGNRIALHAR